MAGLKRRVPLHSLRYFISMVGLFSKPGLLPWYARNPPGWSQLFLGTVCKGDFTRVIATKCQKGQKSQKKPSHLGPLDGSWQERLADVVTPLWRLSYEEQLKPVINGYRNKSTFSVNRGPDGNPKTVGFYLGTWRDGNVVCVQSNHLKNIPEKHSQVAQYYEVFLRQSPLEPCLVFHEGGYWRELTVRTNSQGHTMAIITFHPQKLSQEELHVQKEIVKEFFIRGPGAACGLTSLYFQESTMTRCSHQQSPYQLLFGEPYIFEELLSLKIRISPDAFFQINTAGAEMLYRTVGELTGVNSDTILLDICCGTGVIGLSLAQHTSRVLGIELLEQAVEDARWTAAFNGITNSEFHTGQAEKILPGLLKSKEDGQSIVAVVNPARAGLHYKVIQAIRNFRAIHTLVFVSCKLHGESTRNVIELCCPPDPAKKLLGEPFVLQQAVPVDLFPHTPHCELVLLFTR
ncbi:tRNA methyltransferase 2 homolog B [Homo sapiens]|uniref:Isoform 3 of tRNA (uracil-5-)-methyltransferase homolog B n=1 Tax=Homo sapiens TaxID=9606 RepID=Q96GJ1-3|nr:tRNA (uracil-5-)-methyltransferase homolog B isoform b [Homo sapiens]XP_047298489.1 tRNA (uracil-5-)-methyltransferase homolog B isoform X2 [Homo sapiens]XP_054183884.1 tRNA (uracil-5-)-methyltransferase homolog B isoform X2 [Homo sapiens]EAX02837.1 chromosome X open reading frame 34, isoform CRA_e [Homo sapiens]KAI2600218.1 tRNA methyltransferase 2-like B [Homo sapiens]KAI4000425.1 tRNA methyltransferase 2 homolog B [Homo sapiens]|eukprot:NP_001161443.1 tRNA (uracil(54)-C(5))-methyltransferase homolog isoform b [Homo sapiens]